MTCIGFGRIELGARCLLTGPGWWGPPQLRRIDGKHLEPSGCADLVVVEHEEVPRCPS
jgi:hypothetical protein